jgi:superfamily II DNA or RNA helicase
MLSAEYEVKMSTATSSGEGIHAPSSDVGVVTLRKSGNILEISTDAKGPPPAKAQRALEQVLAYTQKKLLYGASQFDADGVKRRLDCIPKQLYRYDPLGRMVCSFGFIRRVKNILEENGVKLRYIDVDPERKRPKCYESSPDRVKQHFQFRARQEECLHKIMMNMGGVVHAITGFGKMAMMAMQILTYPHATFHVITRSGQLVEKIGDYLTRYIPNIGQVGYGRRKKGDRVTVFTAASMHHSDWDADFILCDEAHELLADGSVSQLRFYQHARPFAYTASPTGRLDGSDIRMEGIFGNTIFHISYPEGVKLGLVVPIRVDWTDVQLYRNPCAGLDDVKKKRWGLWQNTDRNAIIAKKARQFSADDQVLILVETIEHAVYLRQHLPEFKMVYAPNESDILDSYKKSDLIPQDEQIMTPTMLEALRNQFEQGHLKKVISTSVWSVGIDPQQLTALVRADGAASEIRDIQAPGRVSRIHTQSGKNVGIVCDFRDQFDTGLYNKARKRFNHYKAMEWDQIIVSDDGTTSPMR